MEPFKTGKVHAVDPVHIHYIYIYIYTYTQTHTLCNDNHDNITNATPTPTTTTTTTTNNNNNDTNNDDNTAARYMSRIWQGTLPTEPATGRPGKDINIVTCNMLHYTIPYYTIL